MNGPLLKELMQTINFRVTVVEEADVVEICGALKVSRSLVQSETKKSAHRSSSVIAVTQC